MSEERLEAEVQIVAEPQETPPDISPRDEMLDEVTGASRLSPEVQSLIERCMEGTEPLGRGLKTWEVLKFNPVHVNICVLRAAGFKGREIAEILGQDQAHISVILRHPYGIKLVNALTVRSSVKVFDIRTKLEEYASDLLDETFKLAIESEDLDSMSKVTFGMLDRAGYSPAQSGGGDREKEGFSASDTTMRRLFRAMEQSDQVRREVMPGFVPRRPPDEGSLPALSAGGVGGEDDARKGDPQQVEPRSAAGGQR